MVRVAGLGSRSRFFFFYLCFPICSLSPMSVSISLVGVGGFALCLNPYLRHFTFLSVDARRPSSGGIKYLPWSISLPRSIHSNPMHMLPTAILSTCPYFSFTRIYFYLTTTSHWSAKPLTVSLSTSIFDTL